MCRSEAVDRRTHGGGGKFGYACKRMTTTRKRYLQIDWETLSIPYPVTCPPASVCVCTRYVYSCPIWSQYVLRKYTRMCIYSCCYYYSLISCAIVCIVSYPGHERKWWRWCNYSVTCQFLKINDGTR